MDIKEARGIGDRLGRSVFSGLGGGTANSKICVFWLKGGRCNRNPCRFMHSLPQNSYHRNLKQSPPSQEYHRPCKTLRLHNAAVSASERSESDESTYREMAKQSRLASESLSSKSSSVSASERSVSEEKPQSTYHLNSKHSHLLPKVSVKRKSPDHSVENSLVDTNERKGSNSKILEMVCTYWVLGNCSHGDSCRYLHSWFHGDNFKMVAKIQGHKKAITGIALPTDSDKLFSGSNDGTARLWDCNTGQCTKVVNFGAEVGCVISEGPWVFVGLPNTVKAYNIQTSAEYSLSGPVGKVYSMDVTEDGILFAGAEDGVISAWKCSITDNPFELVAYLKGHILAVTCLVVGAKRLYSGSMDHTIRVWDSDTLQCLHTLTSHTDVVMSVLCWDHYLLSCSLDQTIKVWVATEEGNIEVTCTCKEEHGVLTLCGMYDDQSRPILFCSCNDNTIHLYELPSFADRGSIFSKKEVRTIQSGPDGLFFTGDGAGTLNVWKWSTETSPACS